MRGGSSCVAVPPPCVGFPDSANHTWPEEEGEKEHLSTIIDLLNERFGTILGTADQLFFDQMEETWAADEQLVAQAKANPLENFRLVFADLFVKSIVTRMDDNADIFKRVLDDPDFGAAMMEHYLQRVFERARSHPDASAPASPA